MSSATPEPTLPELVAELVALRHACGYRFKLPQRVLRQFVEHCRRQGYPDASITKEAIDGFLYGRHLRSSTVRRNSRSSIANMRGSQITSSMARIVSANPPIFDATL